MGDAVDKPLPLRGPSLPGSLGVRMRGDWETFEEENTGIDMRSGDCADSNVQIDLMKETEIHESNRSGCGIQSENTDVELGATYQANPLKGQGTCKPNNSDTQETFDEEGIEVIRVHETNIQLSLMQGKHAELQEHDLDETGRKIPFSPPIPFGNATFHQDSHEPLEVVPIPHQESDFSLNSSYNGRFSGSQDPTLPLPPGKKYHVFFSYEMADRNWVHSAVDKLESEHGYRCSFHERDFHGGKRVIENITEHIQWSVKTVLVLSPDFLESSWCQFEMKQGIHASIEEARMLIIPVMVRECEVPDTLRSLTYIDATPGTDWWPRFLEAVAAQDTLQVCNDAGNQIAIQPRYENLNALCEIESKFHCCFGETLEVPYVPEELNRPGIQISHEVFNSILSTLKDALGTNCAKLYCCDVTPLCACLMTLSFCLTLSLFIVGFLLLLYNSNDNPPGRDTGITFTVLPLSITVLYLTVFFIHIRWRKKIRKSVMDLNRQHYGSKIIMDVKLSSLCACSSVRAKITFRYYDFQPCTKHLKDFMRCADDAFGDTTLSGYSEQLAVTMLSEYLQEFQDGKLTFQRGSSPRHVRQAKFLCQYVEDELQNQEQWVRFCQRKLGIASQGMP